MSTPYFSHPTVDFDYTANNGNLTTGEVSRATFAVLVQQDEAGSPTATYAVSWVAPSDNFCKATGRLRSEALLRSTRARTISVFSNDFRDIWTAVYEDAIANGPCRWAIDDIGVPTRSESVVQPGA